MVLGVTGHRPDKLGFKQYKGYSKEAEAALYAFASQQIQTIKPDIILSGMALGWDLAIADAARGLEIPFKAYVPFLGQEDKWPQLVQERYRYLLREAAEVIYTAEGEYSNAKYQLRNQRLVDDSTNLLALWDGSYGGTCNCIKYANQFHRVITNCWDEWITFTEEIH